MPLFQPDDASHATCLVQYCDDTQLAVLGSPRDAGALVACLEQNLAELAVWLRKNGLKVNADKTQLMVLHTKISVNFHPLMSNSWAPPSRGLQQREILESPSM